MKTYLPICLALGILVVSIAPLSAQSPTAIANQDIHPIADSIWSRNGHVGMLFDFTGYLWLPRDILSILASTSIKADFLVRRGFHMSAGVSLLKTGDLDPAFGFPVEVCFGPESKDAALFLCLGMVVQTKDRIIDPVVLPSVHGDLRVYFGKKLHGFVNFRGGLLAASRRERVYGGNPYSYYSGPYQNRGLVWSPGLGIGLGFYLDK